MQVSGEEGYLSIPTKQQKGQKTLNMVLAFGDQGF